MPAAARSNGVDAVLSFTGTGRNCGSPIITSTGTGDSNVFINGIPAVKLGNIVAPHPAGGCGLDASPLTTGSDVVFINGMKAGRIADRYTADNIIISGSTNIFFS
jgi:uncharacterized Zn-binding protein involved in type VI secretion